MYLGIDLGTTNLKIILVDDKLNCIATESVTLTISRPHPLWSEQNPLDWWNALNLAMKNLREKNSADLKKIKTIGFSGQQHGAVLLDEKGNVLRPAILWNDGRSGDECLELMKKIPDATQIVGSIIMPGFTAPKLLWIKKHEPDIFKKINKILLPKDYLRFIIGGDFATDLSDASSTAWLDIKKRKWSNELLAACDLTIQHMPNLFEGNEVTGKIKKEIAHAWGLNQNVKLVAGAGDNAASAISMGKINPRTAYLSLGTSATFFIACERYQPNPPLAIHTWCHAVPNYWHHIAVHLNGASNIAWWTNLLGSNIEELLTSARKNKKLQDNNLIFLPYLSGERTPHNNPHATGAFFGMTHDTDKAAMTMAVLEGTIFGIALGYEALMQDSSIKIDEISVVGGGSKNDAWGIMFASALQKPLTYRKVRDVGSALGAAKLAWMADTKNSADTIADPEIEKILQPNDDLVSQYKKKFKLFKEVYKNVF
ncbi:MAG TPA: xylulokinase [Coxiellaceae bacterium]|nr:MAG: xylulokinase [Gammaproteobacteria bacterium RIFCSPHIGHO2_12_FULL_36_30]HLB56888.1 xylulokinase [Coxiellaceae bacterium]